MGQSRSRILPGHRTRETETFLKGHIRRHTNTADRDPAGGVVDDDDSSQTHGRPMDVNDPRRTEFVCETECVLHIYLPLHASNRRRRWIDASQATGRINVYVALQYCHQSLSA
jgi:hypothetical protein